MSSTMGRRSILRLFSAAAGIAALEPLFGRLAASPNASGVSPFGPLTPRPAVEDDRVLLALPPNFRYRIVASAGQLTQEAIASPSFCDGMAAFAHGNLIRLVRNHEYKEWQSAPLLPGTNVYDQHGRGGTTTLVVDRSSRTLMSEHVSLNGTVANCAGGATPWGSWISCEETTVDRNQGFQKVHGYCFEVPATADGVVPPEPLKAMGRFRHEAVAVDPRTSIAYLTEDEGSAGLYRFVPNVPRRYAEGGKLQMLAVVGRRDYDTRRGQQVGRTLPVHWVDIPNPDPPITKSEPQPVYRQGRERGAARFGRLEGAVFAGDSVYFTSTNGGEAGLGQVWRYRPYVSTPVSRRRSVRHGEGPESLGELTLMVQPTTPENLKAPDNLCVAPGGSIVICEDSAVGVQHLRIFTPDGTLFDFAANALAGFEHVELTGPTFSPDGRTLFVNIWDPGFTLAVWGPWHRGLI